MTTAVVVVSLLAAFYYYNQYQKSQEQLKKGIISPSQASEEAAKQAAQEANKKEVQSLVAKVGALMELPNEEPTIATVVDKEKLKDQAFFAKAENDDKLLIFTQARKAVLYRLSNNKIINVAVINIVGQESASPSAQVKKLSLALFNGTQTSGLTNNAEKQLADLNNLEVVAKEQAKIRAYAKTLVVDLSGVHPDVASLVAQKLGGDVSLLPAEEQKPDADILVILGSNYQPQ